MGVDLTLLPFEPGDSDTWAISHSLLFCERRSELFHAIGERETAHGVTVPKYFASYTSREGGGEPHYGDTQDTPYGDPLRTLTVRELGAFAEHDGVLDNPTNRAVWAYLDKLAPATRVALYWH